jgi:hypothetical protein
MLTEIKLRNPIAQMIEKKATHFVNQIPCKSFGYMLIQINRLENMQLCSESFINDQVT